MNEKISEISAKIFVMNFSTRKRLRIEPIYYCVAYIRDIQKNSLKPHRHKLNTWDLKNEDGSVAIWCVLFLMHLPQQHNNKSVQFLN